MTNCEDCGKEITGRGKSNKCMSCVKKGTIPWNKNFGSEICCRECGEIKNFNEFPKTKNGYRNFCKECYRKIIRNYHKKNNGYKKTRQKYKKINKIQENIRARIVQNLKSKNIEKTFSISKMINQSMTGIKKHIEKQFVKKMNWENHGDFWHIDHIIPISLYDFSNIKEIKKCWNKRNLRPLSKKENLIKSKKLDLFLVEKYNIMDLLPKENENVFV